ncbi:putative oleosin [Helianthus annuus]|nr:putative oleosin [Helianthus annuus]KAJ0819874.1 putative oleosin [Helianthus annuus]KAJ0834430.1 putative oleosin [Helianthus annuus]
MAEHHQQQQHPINTNTHFHQNNNVYSTSKLLAVLTLFPIGGLCFLLSGLILTGTLIGLTIATPVFFIFSPVLLPAILTVGLMVTGFLTSVAFGITALSSLAYIVSYFRRTSGWRRKRRGYTTGYLGQKVKDMGLKTQETDWA